MKDLAINLIDRIFCHYSVNGELKKDVTARIKNSKVIIGENARLIIGPGARIWDSEIILEPNTTVEINQNCEIRSSLINAKDSGSLIDIGALCTMTGATIISEESEAIIIGTNCMFSTNVFIRNSDGHSIMETCGEINVRANPAKTVIIDHNCWIGIGAMVLKGAKIKNNCIISAGSIITSSITEKNKLPSLIYVKNNTIKYSGIWRRDKVKLTKLNFQS